MLQRASHETGCQDISPHCGLSAAHAVACSRSKWAAKTFPHTLGCAQTMHNDTTGGSNKPAELRDRLPRHFLTLWAVRSTCTTTPRAAATSRPSSWWRRLTASRRCSRSTSTRSWPCCSAATTWRALLGFCASASVALAGKVFALILCVQAEVDILVVVSLFLLCRAAVWLAGTVQAGLLEHNSAVRHRGFCSSEMPSCGGLE